jgi:hypothetical protein
LSLTLREEHRLRLLRNIFGPKREKLPGEWRRLHSEELHNVYGSPTIIKVIKSRRMRRAGDVSRLGEMRSAYRILVGEPKGRKPLGRPTRGWE